MSHTHFWSDITEFNVLPKPEFTDNVDCYSSGVFSSGKSGLNHTHLGFIMQIWIFGAVNRYR